MTTDLLTARQVAARLQVSLRGARELLAIAEAAGEIQRVVISARRHRWYSDQVDTWIRRRALKAQERHDQRQRLLLPSVRRDPRPEESEVPLQQRRRRSRTLPPPPVASPQVGG